MSLFKISEIFFIDDDAIVRMVGKKILKSIEFTKEVSQFENGKDAIEEIFSRIQQNKIKLTSEPILVLLDINMPIMDGWDFLDEFCKLENSVKEKFLISIITSSIDTSDKEKAFSYPEVLDYISKPLSGKHVTDFLSRHGLYES
ncbi:response regulator [Algoriphagus sp. AK58]|uniref:response regulator n=1 Tax=Algoriphagus sp. AK58 TaxID=1406877 RepID=UPI00165045C3|nr:response regulator [Algoriphagus sp. AK58]MBC6367857.1 response regulator [Algoriphagus sp. AK58]